MRVCLKKETLFLGIGLLAALCLSGCGAGAASSEASGEERSAQSETEETIRQYDSSDVAMGTVVSETIYTSGEDLTGSIVEILKDVEEQYISWRVEESDIAHMNKNAGNPEGVSVSGDTAAYLEQSLQIARDSDGAFDPTVGRITRLWDIDGENPRVPSQEELSELLSHVGYQKVKLHDNQVIMEANTSMDLGAVGKGIGCDEAATLLKGDSRVSGAVVSVGGSILVLGEKPDGSSWKVAVTDPLEDTSYLGVLELSGEHYVSTSGNYEKYFIQDNVRYHHILDPSSGYPAESGLISVTVLGDNGLECDGLSTACFVLGLEKSLELLEKYQAEAIFVDENQNVFLTEGAKEYFTLTAEGYQIQEIPD